LWNFNHNKFFKNKKTESWLKQNQLLVLQKVQQLRNQREAVMQFHGSLPLPVLLEDTFSGDFSWGRMIILPNRI
jgi:hypothetical protein